MPAAQYQRPQTPNSYHSHHSQDDYGYRQPASPSPAYQKSSRGDRYAEETKYADQYEMTPPPAKKGGDSLASTEDFFNEVCTLKQKLCVYGISNNIFGLGGRHQRSGSKNQRSNRKDRGTAQFVISEYQRVTSRGEFSSTRPYDSTYHENEQSGKRQNQR